MIKCLKRKIYPHKDNEHVLSLKTIQFVHLVKKMMFFEFRTTKSKFDPFMFGTDGKLREFPIRLCFRFFHLILSGGTIGSNVQKNCLTLLFSPCTINDVWPDSGFDSLVNYVWGEGNDWYQQYHEVEGG